MRAHIYGCENIWECTSIIDYKLVQKGKTFMANNDEPID